MSIFKANSDEETEFVTARRDAGSHECAEREAARFGDALDETCAKFASTFVFTRVRRSHPFGTLRLENWIVGGDLVERLARLEYSDAERIALLGETKKF